MERKYRIDFIPTKRRARSTRTGHHYSHPKNEQEATAIRAAYTGRMHEGAVEINIETFGKLPKGTPKCVTSEVNVRKPDVDNTAKEILDALNGIAFKDDRFVVKLTVTKHPRVRCGCEYTTFEVVDA